MENNLQGKIVAITGGARGIGFSDARAFLAAGARLAICSLHKQSLAAAERKLKVYGDVFAFAADVRDSSQVQKFVDEAVKRFGRIDVMINNAGIAWWGYFHEQKIASIDNIVDTNLKGVLYGTKAALKHMIKQKSGVIINMSSQAGEEGIAEFATYCSTKFAVRGFSESLADELASFGISVYSICPGAVDTDLQLDVTGSRGGISPERVSALILKVVRDLPKTGKCFEP